MTWGDWINSMLSSNPCLSGTTSMDRNPYDLATSCGRLPVHLDFPYDVAPKVTGHVTLTNSTVEGEAQASDHATVKESTLCERARAHGHSEVTNGSSMAGYSQVGDHGLIDGTAMDGHSVVKESAQVRTSKLHGQSRVTGESHVSKNSELHGNSWASGNAKVIESKLFDNARVDRHGEVTGSTLRDNSTVQGYAKVTDCDLKGNSAVVGGSSSTPIDLTELAVQNSVFCCGTKGPSQGTELQSSEEIPCIDEWWCGQQGFSGIKLEAGKGYLDSRVYSHPGTGFLPRVRFGRTVYDQGSTFSQAF